MEEPISALIYDVAESIGIAEITMHLLIGAIGLSLMAVGFHHKSEKFSRIFAMIGWPLIGLFFYLYSSYFVEISDPLLVLMTGAALPVGFAISYWEYKSTDESLDSRLWMRGCIVWSMIPYYAVYGIPILNIWFVEFTADSANLLLDFSGLGGYETGQMMIDRHDKVAISTEEWDGNLLILTEPLGEAGFFAPMNKINGENIVIFILACSALQSMAVFIGGIVALKSVHWKRRMRALIITIPTIHILNVFRNAGIVWLTDTYRDWSFYGIGMFEFAHSYAAKGISLLAMFLMALALFDILPELHKNIMKILSPFSNKDIN